MKKVIIFLCLLMCLSGCNAVISDNSESNNINNNSNASEYDLSIKDNDRNSSYLEGKELVISDENINITKGGTYVLSGEGSGLIIVDAGKDYVQLVFDGVNINTKDFGAVYVVSADKVTITLKEGSDNYLSDSSSYSQIDDNKVDGVIYSKADLVINGSGSLTVTANYAHGIVSKDDLIIAGSTINVTALNGKAVVGKDCLKVADTSLNLTSYKDCFSSDNEEDEYRGYIYIESGNININTQSDGIYGYNLVVIDDGEINIKCSDTGNSSLKGIKSDGDIEINGGNITIESNDDSIHASNDICINGGTLNLTSGDDGIHSDISVEINGGNITILDSYEGIEGQYVTINGGDINVKASDDGINAADPSDTGMNNWDREQGTSKPQREDMTENVKGFSGEFVRPDGKESSSTQSGMSSEENREDFGSDFGKPDVTKNEGRFSLDENKEGSFSNMQGKMPSGPNDMSAMESDDAYIIINGGNIVVDAGGDGIDSNGDITITGGKVIVYGPTNSGNAPVDQGGQIYTNGGTLFALGNGSMQTGISSDSKQAGTVCMFNTSYGANTVIKVLCNDEEVTEFSSLKSFNCLVLSHENIKKDDSIVIEIEEDSYSFTAGESSGTFGFPGMGGKGFNRQEVNN